MLIATGCSNTTQTRHKTGVVGQPQIVNWRHSSESRPYPTITRANDRYLRVSIGRQRVYVMSPIIGFCTQCMLRPVGIIPRRKELSIFNKNAVTSSIINIPRKAPVIGHHGKTMESTFSTRCQPMLTVTISSRKPRHWGSRPIRTAALGCRSRMPSGLIGLCQQERRLTCSERWG